ncbi:LysE family transporter [Frigidibacter sp. MR17.14]|uniref:LysE family transporter n=1 Tax=Frigidibacter sp. MR17.14 TaxID=3126509 RepID=UPI003012B91D
MVSFTLTYALLAILPGPNFVVVSRAAWSGSRMSSLATALGVALGAAALALAAGLAFGPALAADPGGHLSPALRAAAIGFAALLALMGLRLLHEVVAPRDRPDGRPPRGGFVNGLATAASNPLSAGFFAASALRLGSAGSIGPSLTLALCVLGVAGVWFATVALTITHARLTPLRSRLTRPMAAVAGLVLLWNAAEILSRLPGS